MNRASSSDSALEALSALETREGLQDSVKKMKTIFKSLSCSTMRRRSHNVADADYATRIE